MISTIYFSGIPYSPLSEMWTTMSPQGLDRILDQLVDIFIKMYTIELPLDEALGSIHLQSDGTIVPGPVLEEVMWQL
jgi:hypothetical protein